MEKSQLREALFLWASPTPESDLNEMAIRLKNCQIAVDLFLEGALPLEDYLEIIANQGVDMDNYSQTVESNLSLIA